MKITTALEGGLAGALALTAIHETTRQLVPRAPRMDVLGMAALARLIRGAGAIPPSERKLFWYTMAGDMVLNAGYYALAGLGRSQTALQRGALLGLVAGIGALVLPKPLGLPVGPSRRTPQTALLTLALYTAGGLVAGLVLRALQPVAR